MDLSSKTCVETCPEDLNTFVSLKVCLKNCSSLDPTMWGTKNKICCKIGCEECSFADENFCSKCSNDYFFFLNTNKCVFTCPLDYTYVLSEKTCASCQQGAEICDERNLSKWCKPDFFLSYNSTCSACKSYCPKGTPDPHKQFCCNEKDAVCQKNKKVGICGRLRLEKVCSPIMQRDVPMFILLPHNWDQDKNDTFPVVLSFHGNKNTFATYFDLTFGCHNEDFLVVFPDGDLNTYFCDSPIDPRIRMETFITTELRSFLILNYRARNDRKWANIGVSAGGFGSIAIALKHRDKFCAAACFAAPFIIYDVPDNYMEMRFGNKETNEKNYKPFNITLIAENN